VPLDTIIVAVDGSDASIDAAREGLALLQPTTHTVITTVVEAGDSSLLVGSGFAGGVMSEDEFSRLEAARAHEGRENVDRAAAELQLDGAEKVVLTGDPATTLCELAVARDAQAIVMGSRGRGGLKRALLGSVSDHVVRNAPCPVVITRPADERTVKDAD